ncbi:glycosyltransferase family 4 protein [Lacticaseibacillus saniviri]|uniref:Glycosyltransferase n=1 Tax=Lacticaseibacillus saniviri JCM 17471 = DSM 24301 TaxID=1293598 RepID=A0A0R2MSQ4_9LACO|nr:glycosyltransferase family 4 protein [Lacticaseibacillus saniviri]KRO15248.1 glycosyltransferase [Lacticaseibacillus saniviri JCM 17471 = DSM 24301]MCG4282058.1 glycosyltransferase family 4 protein [Lacticaseibacillus saniviri]
MIDINMFSSADKVAGQGVGAVYTELLELLNNYFPGEFNIRINRYSKSAISHYHTIDPQFYASTFSKKRGRKIGYVHFLPETLDQSLKLPKVASWTLDKYVISFYKRMDQLVVVNPNFIPRLAAHGIDPNKVTYIPNFVSRETFYPETAANKVTLREKYGIPADKFVVFGAGQVQDRKGVDDFIELAKRNPDKQFIWAGGFSFGMITNGYDHLKAAVANAPANLNFTGIIPREDMVDYYNIADLFLLPSFEELFPMAVLEAFSTETPVMVRDLSLYEKIITPYAVMAKDVDAMQTKINQLAVDPDLLATYAKKSQAAAAEYSEDHLAKIWEQFYTEQAKLSPTMVSSEG